jgi:hypothetical protein
MSNARSRSAAWILVVALALIAPAFCQAPPQPMQVVPAEPPAQAAPAAPAQPPAQSSSSLNVPETLHYSISWRIFTAGIATMHLERPSADRWQATVKANSTGFVSRVFKVDDVFVSRFSGEKMCSQGIVKTIHEGRRDRETRIDFDTARKTAVVKETDLNSKKLVRQGEHAIPECVYDVVAALYYVRSIPLEVGKSFQLQINDGAQTLPITVEVQAKEEVKTPSGTFRCIRLEPRVFGGTLFKRSGRMQIWLSDDPQRLLVQLKARLFWGTVSATLQRVERK